MNSHVKVVLLNEILVSVSMDIVIMFGYDNLFLSNLIISIGMNYGIC